MEHTVLPLNLHVHPVLLDMSVLMLIATLKLLARQVPTVWGVRGAVLCVLLGMLVRPPIQTRWCLVAVVTTPLEEPVFVQLVHREQNVPQHPLLQLHVWLEPTL